jgi:hypothetical protein
MARKTKSTSVLAARDTYHVVGPEGDLAVKGAAPHALVTAHERAMRQYMGAVTLTVERRTVFGPRAPLYRVVRDEHGTIYTQTLSVED